MIPDDFPTSRSLDSVCAVASIVPKLHQSSEIDICIQVQNNLRPRSYKSVYIVAKFLEIDEKGITSVEKRELLGSCILNGVNDESFLNAIDKNYPLVESSLGMTTPLYYPYKVSLYIWVSKSLLCHRPSVIMGVNSIKPSDENLAGSSKNNKILVEKNARTWAATSFLEILDSGYDFVVRQNMPPLEFNLQGNQSYKNPSSRANCAGCAEGEIAYSGFVATALTQPLGLIVEHIPSSASDKLLFQAVVQADSDARLLEYVHSLSKSFSVSSGQIHVSVDKPLGNSAELRVHSLCRSSKALAQELGTLKESKTQSEHLELLAKVSDILGHAWEC